MYPERQLSRGLSGDSDKLTVFASGLALGLLIGGGVALLFAPAPGSDVRHAIARRGKRARQRGSDAWEDLRHELRRMTRKRRRHREQQDDE
jgi:gas vesicle protein